MNIVHYYVKFVYDLISEYESLFNVIEWIFIRINIW